MTQLSTENKVLITSAVILAGVGWLGWTYWHYVFNPWTRSGQVRAQVIQITPRVSGTIVDLPIEDNQFVKKGELLFQIDPRTYESTLEGMRGMLAETEDEIEALAAQVVATRKTVKQYEAAIKRAEQKVKGKAARLEDYRAQFRRYTDLVKTGAASEERLDRARADVVDSEAILDGAQAELLAAEAKKLEAEADLARDKANLGAEGPLNARRRTAKARVHSAELNLEFTTVRAPVDGYVTNLRLRLGDHATANKAILALVDVNSYWVYGYFKENALRHISPGDQAVVTLMSYPRKPIEGRVSGKGWGVFQSDGSTAQQLLPSISPTFEWIRLAQRIPVRVEIERVPEGVELVVGATATVLVLSDTAGTEGLASAPAAPTALQ
ncbi:MAG: HlyD family secretion protein [Alphaproteobacteria bacterium]|nr:HlyD family secretion protein [Alphaproteobacteria bacterium]